MKWIPDKLLSFIKIAFPVALLILALTELNGIVKSTDFHLLSKHFHDMNDFIIFLLFIAALIAVSPMFLYDFILLHGLKIKQSALKTAKQSLTVNSISNFIGFGGIAGLMMRNFYYSRYKKGKLSFLKDVTSVTLFSLTGVSVLAWIALIGYPHLPLFTNTPFSIFIVIMMGLYLPLIIGFHLIQQKKGKSSLINGRTGPQLVLSSLMEWAAIFLIIWMIALALHLPISFLHLLPVFIVAACAGNLSMIPGGIGSFDLVFLWGMEGFGVQDEKVLVLLIIYRLSYYVVPFILAALLFAFDYFTSRRLRTL